MKMSSTPFLVGILFSALFVTDVYSVLNSLKGSSIVLSPDVEEPSIISVTWKHGADLAAEWFGGSVTFYRSFKDRCSLDTKSGELTINNVKLEDGGVYTPEINNNVRAAVTLRVFSPVPKPNITHDCKPEQTKCTLTCTFHKTDNIGEVEVSWIVDDRREIGRTERNVVKETKEKTFICSLENSVSSENSTELQNPLLTDDESGRTHIAVGIVLGLFALLVLVAVIVLYKRNQNVRLFISELPIIMRFFNKRKETSTDEEQENLTVNTSANGTEGILKTGSVTTKTSTAAGGDVDQSESSDSIKKETNQFLSEIEKCNPESSVTVTAEINSQNDPNTTNTQEPDQNPDPASSLETKPDPETNTTNRPEPDESPDPAPSSETRPDPEETRPNQESRVTVTAEINHQNESNPREPDLEPATTPSIGTTHEPNTKTDEDPENSNKDPSEEVNHETGSGSAENDPPETERAEASSGSPDGGVSTSEPS